MSKIVSLDAIVDKEFKLHDDEVDYLQGMDETTPVDRYMELNGGDNYGVMGEDSEEATLREKQASKLLQERPLPHYQPF